jgi:hypothetical protein
MMPVSTGVAAALAAPLLEAVGFLEWDIHWSKQGMLFEFSMPHMIYHESFTLNLSLVMSPFY